jgi:hypothetical protein
MDADALETPAQPFCPPSPKRLISHLQLLQELPSLVAPGA